jgi:hypothetical protein
MTALVPSKDTSDRATGRSPVRTSNQTDCVATKQPAGGSVELRVYRICGLNLASNVALPELDPSDSASPDWVLHWTDGPSAIVREHAWYHHASLPDGKPWRSCARQGNEYVVRFHDFGDFRIDPQSSTIAAHPTDRAAPQVTRHLLLDHVIPLCLSFRGREALHASAVATSCGAIGFLGDTGLGKSTLAAGFVAAGGELLGDDCMALEAADAGVFAISSYGALRISDAAAGLFPMVRLGGSIERDHRQRVRLSFPPASQPVFVRAVCVLGRPSDAIPATVELDPLPAADGIVEMVQYAFRIDASDRELLARQFRLFGRLGSQAAFYRLTYPRTMESLAQVRSLLLDALSG